jgi:hypothetical protein
VKAQILYDISSGSVMGMIHDAIDPIEASGARAFIRPQAGQKVVVLDIPVELEHLDRAHLHSAICIDLRAESPRIVAAE